MSSGPLLFVDDDENDIQLTLMGFELQGFAHEVIVARDGTEALAMLREGYGASRPLPAAILTDLKMPRMDGLELLQRVKSDPRLKDIPVLILTSSGYEADIKEAQRLGACSYLRKPDGLDGYGTIVAELRKVIGP